MSLGYGKVKHKAAHPSSHSGNGGVLLLFVSKRSEIARDHPTQRPGNKDSFSLQRLFFAEISVYVLVLTEAVFLAELYNALQPQNQDVQV